MSCEDWPCCGHEFGCCPDFVGGKQINMVCVCGAKLPINSHSSICPACMDEDEDGDRVYVGDYGFRDDDGYCDSFEYGDAYGY